MPTPELMTWVPSRKRWTRMHKGKRFWVSCRQLGCPETKEESLQSANAWWRAKQAELDAMRLPAPRTPLPGEDLVSPLFSGGPWTSIDAIAKAVAHMLESTPPKELEPFAEQIRHWIQNEPVDSRVWERFAEIARSVFLPVLLQRTVIDGKPLPAELEERLPPARTAQFDRGKKDIRGDSTAETERTIKANVDRWVATQQALVSAGSLAPDHADNRRICLNHFAGFLGEVADVETIDAARLHDFYLWCLQKVEARRKDNDRKAGWSVDYAKKVFNTARTFVRFLWEGGLIELPRNVNSRGFRFNGGAKAIKIWTVDEVKHVISEAPGQLKLHILLMANCGFTQVDVSNLLDTEVDWSGGRIIRKRSKTGDKESTPVVNYPLWPLTFELLQKYRSGSEVVLLTESGLPFVRKELVNGEYKKADCIRSNFAHVKKRLKFKKSMKLLRKTGATLLDRFDASGGISTLYLGHSPRSMKDRHYSAPDQAYFDRAIQWLGQQFGFVESDGP